MLKLVIFLTLCLISLPASELESGAAVQGAQRQVSLLAETSYWVWAGVPLPASLSARIPLYLHQGTIHYGRVRGSGELEPVFLPQGLRPAPMSRKSLYLVFRIQNMPSFYPDPALMATFLLLASRWEARGNHVSGLQIDYDCPTRLLGAYARYLERVRSQLPKNYQLSITGLAEWVTDGNRSSLEALARSSDEVVFQFYSGRAPIPYLNHYLPSFHYVHIPFKIGLLTSMKMEESDYFPILNNPYYRGSLVFLLQGDLK